MHQYHPWRHLRSLSAWNLVWATLPVEILGLTDFERRRITLDPRQLQAERRSTLAHELVHVERGPVSQAYLEREEEAVNAEAARRLIGIRELGEAMAWSEDPHEIADELWVDVPTLEARLRHLHPSERAYLMRRLGDE